MNNFIDPTPTNIEWLLNRLYELKRELQTHEGFKVGWQEGKPYSFVILTRTKEERWTVEKQIFRYIHKKYGLAYNQQEYGCSEKSSTFNIAGVTFTLADLELTAPVPPPVPASLPPPSEPTAPGTDTPAPGKDS